MKLRKSPPGSRIVALLILPAFIISGVSAADLTPAQLAKVQEQLAALREKMDGKIQTRNLGAGDRFLAASNDPKAALQLYLDCHKTVKYDWENRKESDFRAWKEQNEGRFSDEAFLESLQIQLRYLAISCKAAEVEERDQVINPLLDYVNGLSNMQEKPHPILFQSVGGSIFAEAYHLEKMLSDNKNWEPVPFNIGGIYQSSIFPYLREEKPENLMNAWDRRIEQETRMVAFLEAQNEKELRGLDRDKEIRARDRQNSQRGIVGSYDPEKFARETLPNLKWSKLLDKYRHVDQVMGAKDLLDYINQNMANPLSEDWLKQLEELMSETAGAVETAADPTGTAPPVGGQNQPVNGPAGFD